VQADAAVADRTGLRGRRIGYGGGRRSEDVAGYRAQVAGPVLASRLEGLGDELQPGVRRKITDEQAELVIPRPWIWRAFGLKPHLVETWKSYADPQFIDKVRDFVACT